MMAATEIRLSSSPAFDDQMSIDASLEDFEGNEHSPALSIPSQHSGFKSSETGASSDRDEHASDQEDNTSDAPWSPPAWRHTNNNSAGGWYRHQPYSQDRPRPNKSKSASRSRGTSHDSYESANEDDLEGEDTTRPADIPLPRGSLSPAKDIPSRRSASPIKELQSTSVRKKSRSISPSRGIKEEPTFDSEDVGGNTDSSDNKQNFIRFALRAEVQQRTEPIEAVVLWVRTYSNYILKSWTSLASTILTLLVTLTALRLITKTPQLPPSPDLVKVAGLAKSFEPLIFYSENGVRQIGDLQETGVAVWDLGESLRYANMTSTPLMVNELDLLSQSLKGLAIELTKFFASVDGDIDGILIVMDWARRELDAVSRDPGSSLSSAFTNIYSLLSAAGIFENRGTGTPTPLGKLFTSLFGSTRSQRTHTTLHRTFHEFLGVLEESINSELTYSTALFALFESIDRQFLNLQRVVVREKDTQEREETEFLSSLWTRLVGPDQARLKKYEKNKSLLASVRAKTTQNKSLLQEHNTKLVALKGSLETLRQKLMSPLVSRPNGSTLTVEDQVRGLEGTYEHLRRVREKQKDRVLEVLYGAGGRTRSSIVGEDRGAAEIEA